MSADNKNSRKSESLWIIKVKETHNMNDEVKQQKFTSFYVIRKIDSIKYSYVTETIRAFSLFFK